MEQKNKQALNGLEDAILAIPRESLRHNVSAALKKNGTTNLVYTDRAAEVITALNNYPFAILIIDYDLGKDQVTRVLETAQETIKSDIRPIYLLCGELTEEVVNIATDFNVLKVRSGEINGEQIAGDVAEIYSFGNISDNAREAIQEAAKLRHEDKWDQAALKLAVALEHEPDNGRIKVELAENFNYTGSPKKALDLLKEDLGSENNSVRVKSLTARAHMKMGNFDRATEILQELHTFNPRNVKRLIDLGNCLINQDDAAEAEKYFDQALAIDKESKGALSGKGQCALLQDNLDEALRFLKSSSEAELAAVFNNTAVICIRNQNYDDGFKLYRTAVSQLLTDKGVLAKVIFNMGLGYLKQERRKAARQAFEKALELAPDYEKAKHNLRVLNVEKDTGEKLVDVTDGDLSSSDPSDDIFSFDGDTEFDDGDDIDDSFFESLG